MPKDWVKMSIWRGGAGEYGLTKMDEKIMCPQCAWENNMGPQPTQVRLPPLQIKPPSGPMKPLFASSTTKALPKGK